MSKDKNLPVNFLFILDSKLLRDGLTKIKKFVPTRSAINKVVDMIQLRVNSGRVYLEVNHYPYSGTNRVSLVIGKPEKRIGVGAVPLHFSSFNKAVSMGKGPLEISHKVPAEGDSAIIVDLKTKAGTKVSRKIKVQPEFDDIFSGKTFEFSKSVIVNNDELLRALRHILRATCGDGVPANYTNCVYFTIVDKAASRKGTYKGFAAGLYLISTDGRRLNYVRLAIGGAIKGKDINSLVNVQGLNALLPVISGADGISLQMRIAEKEKFSATPRKPNEKPEMEKYNWGLDFNAPEFTASLFCLDTPYPDWVKVLPENEPKLKLRFNAPDYIEAIKAVSDISRTRTGRDLIGFHFEDGHLVIRAKDDETKDEATSRIPAEIISGEPDKMFVCVNYVYAQEAVLDETGEVTLECHGVLQPLVFNGTFERVGIVMPVNNEPKGGGSGLLEVPEHVIKANKTEEDPESGTTD